MDEQQALIVVSIGFFLIGMFSFYRGIFNIYIRFAYLILGIGALIKYITKRRDSKNTLT